jgi:hypothetical protein
MMPTIRLHPDTTRAAIVDAAVAALKGHPAVEREGVIVRGRMLLQDRPSGTRRYPLPSLRVLLSVVAIWEVPTEWGWRHVDPPNVLRDVAARASEWAPHAPEPPRRVPRTRIARARQLFQDALPGRRIAVVMDFDGYRDVLRVRYGFGRLGEGGNEVTMTIDEAPAVAAWLANQPNDEPMLVVEFAQPKWQANYRWSLRAWRLMERAHETDGGGR